MKSVLWRFLTGFALVSVVSLALNCGPVCDADSVGVPTESESVPCHQGQTPENAPGCDWDSGSLSLEGVETQSFKLIVHSVFFILPLAKFKIFTSDRFSAAAHFSPLRKSPLNSLANLSSVRILV